MLPASIGLTYAAPCCMPCWHHTKTASLSRCQVWLLLPLPAKVGLQCNQTCSLEHATHFLSLVHVWRTFSSSACIGLQQMLDICFRCGTGVAHCCQMQLTVVHAALSCMSKGYKVHNVLKVYRPIFLDITFAAMSVSGGLLEYLDSLPMTQRHDLYCRRSVAAGSRTEYRHRKS